MNRKIYIFIDSWLQWGGQGLKWHVQLSKQFGTEDGMIYCFLLSLSFFPSITPSYSFQLSAQPSPTQFDCFPKCHVAAYVKGLCTQRTDCVNLGHTRFTLSAVIMTQTAKGAEGGLLHSFTLNVHDSWQCELLTPIWTPTGHCYQLWGCEGHPQVRHSLSHTEEPRRGRPVGGEYDNTIQRKWAQCSGM